MASKMAKIRSILSSDGIVGSKERWWAGNKAFDFVQSGLDDDDAAQETSNNISERNERLVEELMTPDTYEAPAIDDLEIMQRGLDFILSLGLDDDNFKEFGTDVFSCFYDVATTAEEPMRKFALLRTELASRMWLRMYPTLRSSSGEDPSPDELIDFVMGIYALERVGIGHDSKEELRSALARCSFEDFFDLDIADFKSKPFPVREAPLSFRDYTRVLTCSFYAVKTGLNIQIDMRTVLKLLPVFRPYEDFPGLKADDDDFDEYADQLTLIFNVIHVLSNYGELSLSPGLIPQEYDYLCDPQHMARAISFQDVHLVGEMCHCLRLFGIAETDDVLSSGLNFLRSKQRLDGSWPARGDTDSAYFRYHAAMCAVSCLNPKRYRGFGPSDPLITDDLMINRYATSEGISSGYAKIKSEIAKKVELSLFPVHVAPLDSFMHIKELYASKAESVRSELNIPLSIYGIHRLKYLLDDKELFSEARGNGRRGGYKQTLEDRKKALDKRNKMKIKRLKIEDDDD